jgi:hypothetical protein
MPRLALLLLCILKVQVRHGATVFHILNKFYVVIVPWTYLNNRNEKHREMDLVGELRQSDKSTAIERITQRIEVNGIKGLVKRGYIYDRLSA